MCNFKVGDWVTHPEFGIGKIISYKESGANPTVEVYGSKIWGTRSTLDGTFNRDIRLTYLEHWEPKEDEFIVRKFGKNRAIIMKYTTNECIIGKDPIIEPFVGELPSFF